MRNLFFITLIYCLVNMASASSQEVPKIKNDPAWLQKKIEEIGEKIKTGVSHIEVPELILPSKVRERLVLRAGPGITQRKIHASNKTEDNLLAGGFTTSFTYTPHLQWEVGIASYIYFGKIDRLEYAVNGNTVHGNGSFRSTTFLPIVKYITDISPKNAWNLYLTGGPAWSLQSFKLQSFIDSHGVVRNHHKITYESRGAVIGFGFQEMLMYKELHAAYVEFLYSYMEAHKVNLVDSSDFTKVQTVSYDDQKSPINGNIFMLNFGIVLF